jgi:hypothetical protein
MDGLQIQVNRKNDKSDSYPLSPRIIVACEQKFGMGIGKALESQRMEILYFLAYEAVKRSGEVLKPYGDEFLDSLVSVELISDDSFESTAKA